MFLCLSKLSSKKHPVRWRSICHCYWQSAAQDRPNGRLSSSFSFFSFWLIKTWYTSNEISDHAAPIDKFSYHNSIQKIYEPIIENEHIWVCTKFMFLHIPLSLRKLLSRNSKTDSHLAVRSAIRVPRGFRPELALFSLANGILRRASPLDGDFALSDLCNSFPILPIEPKGGSQGMMWW